MANLWEEEDEVDPLAYEADGLAYGGDPRYSPRGRSWQHLLEQGSLSDSRTRVGNFGEGPESISEPELQDGSLLPFEPGEVPELEQEFSQAPALPQNPAPEPMDGPGTYPDQAIDPQQAALESLAGRAGELSEEPEAPAYTPAAELPEDTSPRSFRDLGDESVDELENASAEVAGIAQSLQDIERDMGGSGDEESADVALKTSTPSKDGSGALSGMTSEEARWREASEEDRVPNALGNFFDRLRSLASPRTYTSADAARDSDARRRATRGNFDYERQLRNETRNEAQEDEDRGRKFSEEDAAKARRQTVEGREDTVWDQSQQDRSREESLRSGATSSIRSAVSGMLQAGGIENAEELVAELDSSDAQSVRALQAYAQMGSLNQSQERDRQSRLEQLRLSLEAKASRRRGGGNGRRAITPGSDEDVTQLNRLVEARRGTFRSLQGREPNDEEDAEIVRRAQLSLAGGDAIADRQLLARAETTEELPDAVRQRLTGKFSDEEMARGQAALDSAIQAWESLPDEESRTLVLTSLDPAAQGVLSQFGVRAIGAIRAGRTRTDSEIATANTIRNYLNLKLKDLSGGAVTFSEAIRSGQATGAEALSPNPQSLTNVLRQDAVVARTQRGQAASTASPGQQRTYLRTEGGYLVYEKSDGSVARVPDSPAARAGLGI